MEFIRAFGQSLLKKPTQATDFLWYGLYLFVVAYGYYIFTLVRECIWLRKFKGPTPLPIIGTLYTPDAIAIIKYLASLKKRYGSVFTFWMFARPYVCVTDPSMVNQIFYETKIFPKGPDYDVFAIPFGNGLVTSGEERHKADKSLFLRFFQRDNVIRFVNIMNDLVRESITGKRSAEDNSNNKKFERSLDDYAEKGEAVDIENFFAVLAMRTFAKFSMNWSFSTPDRESEVCAEISKGSYAVGLSVIHSWMPSWLFNKMGSVKYIKKARDKIWQKDVLPFVVKRREMLEKTPELCPDDMLTAMLKSKTNNSDQDVMDHVLTLLSAGHDTTAYFSSYFMLCMGFKKNVEIQQRLYNEIKQNIEDKIVKENLGGNFNEEKISKFEFEDAYVSEDDYVTMTYLNACMQETLRLYAIIPQVTRMAKEDFTFKSETSSKTVTVPKGVNLFIPMFLINRDPDIWDEPNEFKPDRFNQLSEGKASIWNFTSKKYGYFPFGHGARVCIGQNLALVESAVFLCRMMLRYEILADETFKPNIMSGISLTTSNGINVKLKRRAVTTEADRDRIRLRIRLENERIDAEQRAGQEEKVAKA